MYKSFGDLQLKTQPEGKTIFLNPDEKRRQKNEEIKNKYYQLYQPLTNLQK